MNNQENFGSYVETVVFIKKKAPKKKGWAILMLMFS